MQALLGKSNILKRVLIKSPEKRPDDMSRYKHPDQISRSVPINSPEQRLVRLSGPQHRLSGPQQFQKRTQIKTDGKHRMQHNINTTTPTNPTLEYKTQTIQKQLTDINRSKTYINKYENTYKFMFEIF